MELNAKIPSGPIDQHWTKHQFEMKLVNPANKRKFKIIVVGTGLAGASTIVFGLMLAAAGGCMELAARMTPNRAYRAGAALAVLAGFLMLWANAAVGIIGNENNPANLLFIGILAVGAFGALLARGRPRGMMLAMGCIQSLRCNTNHCPTGITTHNPRLQRGLHPQEKAVSVANYCKSVRREVEVIAHSCGVKEPRRLRRFHARVVSANGLSLGLDELHPDVPVRPEYR